MATRRVNMCEAAGHAVDDTGYVPFCATCSGPPKYASVPASRSVTCESLGHVVDDTGFVSYCLTCKK